MYLQLCSNSFTKELVFYTSNNSSICFQDDPTQIYSWIADQSSMDSGEKKFFIKHH